MKKEKFKKIMKKVFYILLFISLTIISLDLCFQGIDCLGMLYELDVAPAYHDLLFYTSMDIPIWFLMIFYFIGSYLFSSFALHIFSYYLYTGKKNWYKFFREKEKEQKLQNKLEWQEYCKSLENEKKN